MEPSLVTIHSDKKSFKSKSPLKPLPLVNNFWKDKQDVALEKINAF